MRDQAFYTPQGFSECKELHVVDDSAYAFHTASYLKADHRAGSGIVNALDCGM